MITLFKPGQSLEIAHPACRFHDHLRTLARKNGDRVIQRGAGYVLVDGLSGEVVFPVTTTTSTQVGATLIEITKWMGVE